MSLNFLWSMQLALHFLVITQQDCHDEGWLQVHRLPLVIRGMRQDMMAASAYFALQNTTLVSKAKSIC
jgi:hypothetical protein